MSQATLDRSERKRGTVLEAATSLFLSKGYDGTTMDEVAALAGVSKPTLYRYFADKERLYAEIVAATTDNIDGLLKLVAEELAASDDPREGLQRLANKFLTALMQPDLLRLRRLVIANAERFPEVGQGWFSRGFGRVLQTLSGAFQRYAANGRLRMDDPLLAADHFAGLVLWIPLNRAMFSGNCDSDPAELARYAEAAVDAFLRGYGTEAAR
ncbi:TetR family transcriptional regulator [Bosea sp. Tri-44]|uniref:TetR/AcrR family transcriptional regulator n=1 Tax=Bosea sp. Tri-44 TaxID=1972137 RepID=UPI00100DD302|nr:TetR/AcrR family transcriptional regulator [Bosea sp. Tri-44]RXT57267.1 TetR family transcriptional regulator [Bosea sp. Tri-44]